MNKTENISPFVNEPFVNFSLEENKQAMEKAISIVKSELGQNIPLHIGEKRCSLRMSLLQLTRVIWTKSLVM